MNTPPSDKRYTAEEMEAEARECEDVCTPSSFNPTAAAMLRQGAEAMRDIENREAAEREAEIYGEDL